uniref:Armadillo repeat-containing domain-containing protein n=1 Tax=Globisporangium ultimum (strain ATCC 200006 / CBS 805.95 / DAOM BR144) TaxID=431595 RepID=K3X2W6_GLOUD
MPLTSDSITSDHTSYAEALMALAWKNAPNQAEIVRLGAIPPPVSLLRYGDTLTKRVTAEALRNLASSSNRDQMVQNDAIPALITVLQQEHDPAAIGFATWTLGELSKENGGAIFPLLVNLLRHNDGVITPSAAHVFASLASPASSYQSAIVRVGAIPLLVGLLKSARDDATHAAATLTLARLAAKVPENRVLIAQEGAIPLFVGLLKKDGTHGNTQRDVAKALATVAWSTSANQYQIARLGGVSLLVGLLRAGNAETKPFAALATDKLTDGNPAIQT